MVRITPFDGISKNTINIEKLTNTFKLVHRNKQNTSETSYLGMEEFHTPHALSLYIFYLCWWFKDFPELHNI